MYVESCRNSVNDMAPFCGHVYSQLMTHGPWHGPYVRSVNDTDCVQGRSITHSPSMSWFMPVASDHQGLHTLTLDCAHNQGHQTMSALGLARS